MAGAPEEHGGGWRVRWKVPGVTRRQVHTLDDEPTAWKFSEWVTKLNNRVLDDDPRVISGAWDPRSRPKDVTLIRPYMKANLDLRPRLKSEQAKVDIMARAERYAKEWLDSPLTSIDRAAILQLIRKMRVEKKLAASTTHIVLCDFAAVFRAATEEGLLTDNPFKRNASTGRPDLDLKVATGFDKQPRKRENVELRIPRDEWPKILQAALELGERRKVRRPNTTDSSQLYWMLRTLMECGPRIGEVLALRIGDGHYRTSDNFMLVRRTRLRDGSDSDSTKTGKAREMHIPADIADYFQRISHGRPRDATLFASPGRGDRGWTHRGWLYARWSPMLTLARMEFGLDPGLDLYPHALRMNFITWARNDGLSLRDIQAQCGQSSEGVVARYDLGGPEARRATAAVVSTWAPGVVPPA